jgi:hypothetical protein
MKRAIVFVIILILIILLLFRIFRKRKILKLSKNQLLKLSNELLNVFPSIGGIPERKLCELVVDKTNEKDTSSQTAIAKNIAFCKNNFNEQTFLQSFGDQWKGVTRISPTDVKTIANKPLDEKLLKDKEKACEILAKQWVPKTCDEYDGTSPYVSPDNYLKYCLAFAYYYNSHYMILNIFVEFIDRYRLSDVQASQSFEKYYDFLMANGPFRWNISSLNEKENFEVISRQIMNDKKCNISDIYLPKRSDSWENSGFPAQFFAQIASLLDEGIEKMPSLPKNITVFSSMAPNSLHYKYKGNFSNLNVGDITTINAYVSTTLDIDVAYAYTCLAQKQSITFGMTKEQVDQECGILIIHLPKGLKCHYKHDNVNPTYQILIPRQRKYRVLSKYNDVVNGKNFLFVELEIVNGNDNLPHFITDNELAFNGSLDNGIPKHIAKMYQDYEKRTGCKPPTILTNNPDYTIKNSSLNCYLGIQNMSIPIADCKGNCEIHDIPTFLSIYNISTKDEPLNIENRNVADEYGQVDYSARTVSRRKPDWAEREMRKYDIMFLPKNKEECKNSIKNGKLGKNENKYMCPPFGLYSKCNPGGCAEGTHCNDDSVCGKIGTCSGKSKNGKHKLCVCCTPNAICKTNAECGKGKCVEGKCNCDNLDMDYDCNVSMYPEHTSNLGDLKHIGAVVAPGFDSSLVGKNGWWYSFPEGGKCDENQKLGDNGCVWKQIGDIKARVPLKNLLDKGYKVACSEYAKDNCVDLKEFDTNVDLWRKNVQILRDL